VIILAKGLGDQVMSSRHQQQGVSADALEVRVVRKIAEAEAVQSFRLEPAGAWRLPAFTAGAHIDVHTPAGAIRQYSLCNPSSATDHYQIAVLREPNSRGGSASMHDRVQAGSILRISRPRNTFPLAAHGGNPLLLAGGIGVTPLLCMAEQLAASDDAFEMHYCARSASRMAFRERLSNSSYRNSVHMHFDDGPPEQRIALATVLGDPEPGRHLYACGPAGFLAATKSVAAQAGWPADHVHVELFSVPAATTDQNGSFQIRLARSGRTFDVPTDRSAVQVLAEHGVEIPVSCEMGVCGTCLTGVLEGTPDHRDQFQTEKERQANNQFTPCCSRSLTPLLVLDL
jgi:vanillate O-demethylase ferredoxin subunit